MAPVKRVAVIGTGPAGAIAIDALVKEEAFSQIRVFERREAPGGCWLEDTIPDPEPQPPLDVLARRQADTPVTPPSTLPTTAPALKQHRFVQSSIYPGLDTNIHSETVGFSQEPIPVVRSQKIIQRHGPESPFRPYATIRTWIEDIVSRHENNASISYNTTVELVTKNEESGEWTLALRKPVNGKDEDYWWTEAFDAVLVATGHYIVPWIPSIPGLLQFAATSPAAVIHSKALRDWDLYKNKNVVVVGASISGADIAFALADDVAPPLIAVVRGSYNNFFKDWAFQHPNIVRKPSMSSITTDASSKATIIFEDGSVVERVDHIIFGTGYTWTLPFLPQIDIRNNRPRHIYQHIFWQEEPSLCFVGAVQAGFTFKVFEWQAVVAARFLAGRITLPPLQEQVKWEEDRMARTGDGAAFAALWAGCNEDIVEHFEELRMLAGEPDEVDGRKVGRVLPVFQQKWMDAYYEGHNLRIQMWKNGNEAARKRLEGLNTREEVLDEKIPVRVVESAIEAVL